MTDRTHTWKERIKEVSLEIAIIIFAVSVTLMMHNWNDRHHEKEVEKEFLTGIREDLKTTSSYLDKDIKRFHSTIQYYDSVWQQIKSNKIDAAYIDSNSYFLTNSSYFLFDNGRFEGFKSSGNLKLIENNHLLKDLMSLYSVRMPTQQNVDEDINKSRREDFNKYIGTKATLDNSGELIVSKLINDPAVKYQFRYYGQYLHEIENKKKDLIKKMQLVIDEIDEELKGK